jgi:AraC family transcriptional regulator
VISEHWEADPRSVEIIPQFLSHDPVIQGVATRLALEAQSGSPPERLYAESACEFLAHHMIHSYSTLSAPPPRASGGLPARRLKLILDYIEENLAQPIALRQLGELAGISTRHFERAFRQAIGVPPHAYVLRKRVARAQNLLLSEPGLTIDEIAVRAGFSSSSHLSSTFHRQTGYSPTGFRRLQSR